MTPSTFQEFIVLFSGGLGLMLCGCLALPFAKCWSRPVRIGIVCLFCLGSVMIPIELGSPRTILGTAVLFVAIVGFVSVAGLPSTRRALQHVTGMFQRHSARAGMVGAVGLVMVTVSFARFEIESTKDIDQSNEFLTEFNSKPELEPANGISATTDGGRLMQIQVPVEARPLEKIESLERRFLSERRYVERVIRLAPSSDTCNCHGWVFTGGRYWVSPDDVQLILNDNGYRPVSEPRPGDLAIYRAGDSITHTAVVRAASDGKPVLVEGKWGSMGVFLHEVAESCWGTSFTYYRSPRSGHLLVGLGGSPGRSSPEYGNDSIADEEP